MIRNVEPTPGVLSADTVRPDELPGYVVNHEVGHAFGERHRPCPAHGGPAPVMMQQTFSTSNDEIVKITGGDPAIPADGAPNPWPHP